jgi:ribosome-binding protein aMBF1 (putative translation factor)
MAAEHSPRLAGRPSGVSAPREYSQQHGRFSHGALINPSSASSLDVGGTTPDLEVDRNVMATRTRTQRDPKREDLRRLGERIREQRRTKGMTQENLAQSLDLSVAYVSLIERGGRNPPYTTVLAIARALGVTPGRIVTED